MNGRAGRTRKPYGNRFNPVVGVALVIAVGVGLYLGFRGHPERRLEGEPEPARTTPPAPAAASIPAPSMPDAERPAARSQPEESAPLSSPTAPRTEAQETKQPEMPAKPNDGCEITVDAAKILGDVPPLVFGHNVEAADPQFIFGQQSNPTMGRTGDGLWNPGTRSPVPELVEVAREIGITMMRYPGGCLAHNFDWKKAVGPLEERPDFTFGLDEFVAYCRTIGAEPLVTTSAYVGGQQDMADLVEYLNAPADRDHPWARKRAECGHREPYGVVYFEMGNESDHGNHEVKPFRKHTPESYAEWVVESAKLMRAIDPKIRIGALMGTGTGPDDPWNSKVLRLCRDHIDYVIVHTYAVGLWRREPRAAMAAGEQFEAMLGEYRDLVRECTGRDLPLAITEYNAAYVQEKPKPFRFSLAAALFSAEYLRVLVKPETNVLMANYWHFVNGYWGMVRGPRVPGPEPARWKKMPAYWLYRLWGSHFASKPATAGKLVETKVHGPRLEFEGCLHVRPARAGFTRGEVDFTPFPGSGRGYRWQATGDRSMVLEVEDFTGEAYPEFARAEVPPGRTAKLSFECRTTGEVDPTGKFGLGMIDARGWHATRSGLGVDDIQESRSWEKHGGAMVTLPDCPGMVLNWRLICKDVPITTKIEVRDVRVTLEPDFPPYAALTACASLSPASPRDGRVLYLIVFNKHHAEDLTASVKIAGTEVASGRFWQVTGPSLAETNLGEERVRETESGTPVARIERGSFTHTFPKHSMTAFELAVGE